MAEGAAAAAVAVDDAVVAVVVEGADVALVVIEEFAVSKKKQSQKKQPSLSRDGYEATAASSRAAVAEGELIAPASVHRFSVPQTNR